MSDVYYSRGTVTVDGTPFRVKAIGKGAFTRAYVTTGTKTPRVLLFTREDDAGDYSKLVLAEMNQDGNANSFIPKVKRVGFAPNDTTVYEMPLYDTPLTKRKSPQAWAQYRVLKQCWDDAETAMRTHFGEKAHSPYNGHWQMAHVVECARKNKLITKALHTALSRLQAYVADYGSDYSFEFAPRNLAVSPSGRLILLDTTFSRLALQRQRAAARRKYRGY
mgnify:CR=1 FL=1|tara:strand:- start:99 stop:758 length:660 start_codon:yes stop_codon:yes gene_type:complete